MGMTMATFRDFNRKAGKEVFKISTPQTRVKEAQQREVVRNSTNKTLISSQRSRRDGTLRGSLVTGKGETLG